MVTVCYASDSPEFHPFAATTKPRSTLYSKHAYRTQQQPLTSRNCLRTGIFQYNAAPKEASPRLFPPALPNRHKRRGNAVLLWSLKSCNLPHWFRLLQCFHALAWVPSRGWLSSLHLNFQLHLMSSVEQIEILIFPIW